MTIPFIYKKNKDGASTLVIYVDGTTYTIPSDAVNFNTVMKALKAGDYDTVRQTVSIRKSIVLFSSGLIEITDNDELYFNGVPLHSALSTRILEMYREGFDIQPMVNFLTNAMENPDQSAIGELYEFLEHSDLPITEDGYFLAYRVVRNDYKDKYTGTMDNSVGMTIKMDRKDCDPDRNKTCSSGLHFCSRSYVWNFYSSGDRLLVMKINPRDVVSIPRDYNNSKGRCCEFFSLREIENLDDMPKWVTTSSLEVESQVEFDIDEFITKFEPETRGKVSDNLTVDEVTEIKKRLRNGDSLASIGRDFDRHPRTIGRIRDGEIWKNVK